MLRCLLLCCVFFDCCPSWADDFVLDESPATPGEWGYHPANTETTSSNPPGFTWHPQEKVASYELQISSNKDFENTVYQRTELQFSAHCPSQTLGVGDYFWRYRAISKSGAASNWSQARTFSIDDKSVPFPCPPPDEWAGRIPEKHPRLMFTADDLSRLRKLGKGKLAKRKQAIFNRANRLLTNPPDTSEPPLYPEGIEYKSDEWKEIWWGNRRRVIAVADGAATLGFAYQLSEKEEYGKAARDLVLAMTEWDTDGSTNYRYNDEAAMPAMYMTSRAYTWSYSFFSEQEKQAVVEMMRARGRDCYNHLRARQHLWHPYNSHSNRAWHFLGEIAVAFYGEFPEAEEWLEYATTILYTTYPVWSGKDGGWHEGIAYWSSYLQRFLQWSLTLDAVFDVDVFKRPFFQQTGNFALFLMPPGTQTGGFGDMAASYSANRVAPFLNILGAAAQNPYWLWYAKANDQEIPGGYLGYLYSALATDTPAESPHDFSTSTVFRETGIAALNTNILDGTKNVQILFKSSPFGRQSHGYNANNSFLLNINGQRVLRRTGRRDVYGSPHHKQWMWASKSDNSILVNGQGQIEHSREATGEITHFKTSERIDVVVGEAAQSYENLDRFTRRIIFLKPHVVVIHDILEAPESSTFQYNLHAKGPFEIANRRVMWTGEPGRIDIHFLVPTALTIEQTDQFDVPPHEWANFDLGEWHLTADARNKVKQQEFLSVIRVNDAPIEHQYVHNKKAKSLHIKLQNMEYDIQLGLHEFSINSADLSWNFSRQPSSMSEAGPVPADDN